MLLSTHEFDAQLFSARLFLLCGILCQNIFLIDAIEDRACWIDSDCKIYPVCHKIPFSCRCQTNGLCFIVQKHGMECSEDAHCPLDMKCNFSICSCYDGWTYQSRKERCINLNPEVKDVIRFADIPDDTDVPEDIPPTYGVPILMSAICLALVITSIVLGCWCRYSHKILLNDETVIHLQSLKCFSNDMHASGTTLNTEYIDGGLTNQKKALTTNCLYTHYNTFPSASPTAKKKKYYEDIIGDFENRECMPTEMRTKV